jgi:hypothetical protein
MKRLTAIIFALTFLLVHAVQAQEQESVRELIATVEQLSKDVAL